MKANSFFLLLFLQSATVALSQQRTEKLLQFKVVADSVSVEGINVINLVTEQTVITDKNGEFTISVQLEDLLVLTAVNFEYKRKIIEEDDLKRGLIIIQMVPKVTQLDEVIVNEYAHINAESLGIVPQGQKKYTAAERKLKTAGDFKPVHLLGVLGGTLPVDPIINAITGRTANLKEQLRTEKNEQLLEKMKQRFDSVYYTQTLKIPEEYIGGFQFYVITDPSYAATIDEKNDTMALFIISKCAAEFNQLLTIEKK